MPRIPLHAGDERLLGGLDLAATLRAGTPVHERGLLAEADGGIALLSMAERVEADTAARIASVMDAGACPPARAGDDHGAAARFALVALDEGAAEDERPAGCLLERLALHVDLDPVGLRDMDTEPPTRSAVEAARARLGVVEVPDDTFEALCATAVALGIDSLRAPLLAVRAARASAALDARARVEEADTAAAARLVLGPRATQLPASESEDEAADEPQEQPPEQEQGEADASEQQPAPESAGGDDAQAESGSTEDQSAEPPPDSDNAGEEGDEGDEGEALAEVVLEAAQARVPEGLLDASRQAAAAPSSVRTVGKAGARQTGGSRGRPAGVRPGKPGPMARLNIIETLRAAVPWQALRREQQPAGADRPLVEVRPADLRVTRFRQRRETATIFAVDASGSAALNRLNEAKGAVELLLADCYVRRDRVALVAFRGRGAETLLPPTRSPARAKRCLAELPGGGPTPLAAGIDAAVDLAEAMLAQGVTPMLVILTDGRANVARDGSHGRDTAHADAIAAAHRIRANRMAALLVDTAPRPRPQGREIAEAMGARHLPLPQGDAASLSAAVRAETG